MTKTQQKSLISIVFILLIAGLIVEFNNKQLNIHIDFKKGSKWTNSDKHTKAYSAYDTKMKTYRHIILCFTHNINK
jgi:preprotein translocase subunit SecF